MTRIFLAIVGLIYLALGVWCAVAPAKTSEAVGFSLRPGAGDSEFLTVYGGMEVALGLMFLWPLVSAGDGRLVLGGCALIHGCLVLFRTAGFFLYADIPMMTFYFAASEWIVLLLAAVVLWIDRPAVA